MNEHHQSKQLSQTSKTFIDLSDNKMAVFSIFLIFALKRELKYKVL